MNDGRDDTQARPVGGVKPSPNLFQKWSRAPYWGPEEGVALAFGLDPSRVVEAGQYTIPVSRYPARRSTFDLRDASRLAT